MKFYTNKLIFSFLSVLFLCSCGTNLPGNSYLKHDDSFNNKLHRQAIEVSYEYDNSPCNERKLAKTKIVEVIESSPRSIWHKTAGFERKWLEQWTMDICGRELVMPVYFDQKDNPPVNSLKVSFRNNANEVVREYHNSYNYHYNYRTAVGVNSNIKTSTPNEELNKAKTKNNFGIETKETPFF